MARVPIEIVSVGNVSIVEVEQAISIANSVQNEFLFNGLEPIDAQPFKMLAYKESLAEALLNVIEERRAYIRGFHPFLIVIVDTELRGKHFSNLFGSHRAHKGIAVISNFKVENIIIPKGRMIAYFIYYFARYTLNFIAPNHKNHDETRECVFDRKINKSDIIKSMRPRAICDACRQSLLEGNNTLTPAQFEALDRLFASSGLSLDGKVISLGLLPSNNSLVAPLEDESAVKILFLAANPKDTQPLRLDAEIRAIDQALLKAEFRTRFVLNQQWAVQISDLEQHLLRYRPDIVHFSGHGSSSSEVILEDLTGHSYPVSAHALSRLFSVLKDNIKCVILNACYSEQQAQAIAESIDCVVGMPSIIGDEIAVKFVTSFYQALGYGRDLKTAFDLGCIQFNLNSSNAQNMPKLLARIVDPKDVVFVRVT